MLQISELYIYPIKSLGGIKVNQALVTDRGFEYDRRWMLIDEHNRFLSQREIAKMALLKVSILNDGLRVTNIADHTSITIPFVPLAKFIEVIIWDDTCTAQLVNKEADKWFTDTLGQKCRLVYMPDSTERLTDPRYSPADSLTSFSDAYPFMIMGQASLDDLNNRLETPIPINRFRPGIVFTGGRPYQEDLMDRFTINDIVFNGVKLCARCNIPTIDQNTASKGKEPLKTLATYRSKSNNIYLGQNLIHSGLGMLTVGDQLHIATLHQEERFIV